MERLLIDLHSEQAWIHSAGRKINEDSLKEDASNCLIMLTMTLKCTSIVTVNVNL